MLYLHAEVLQDTATGVWQGELVGSIEAMEGMAAGVMLAGYVCGVNSAYFVCK